MSDAETIELDDLTLRGAWKLLCVHMLHNCVARICQARNLFTYKQAHVWDSSLFRENLAARASADRWMEGGVGIVTFEECCEALSITPELARKKIEAYAHARRREKPRNACW